MSDRRKARKRQNAAMRAGSVAGADPPWTPFEESVMPPEYTQAMSRFGAESCCMNSRYQVNVRYLGEEPRYGRVIHLSIKRHDRGLIRDWRELQRIKNEVVDPEAIAVEVFPDEANLVDTANQFHLWVFLDAKRFHDFFPFFYQSGRLIAEGNFDGAKQRDFPDDAKPPDLIPQDEMRERVRWAFKHGADVPYKKEDPTP